MTTSQSSEPSRVASFVQLWKRAGGRVSHWPDAYEKLITCYEEPQRHYHTVAHIDHCLAELSWLRETSDEPMNDVEMALWFHDAVYDPADFSSGNNERRSAEMAGRLLGAAGFRSPFVSTVVALVLASAHGTLEASAAGKRATAAFLDIDLAILGAESKAYDEYERQVRCEYAFAPRVIFCAKRAKLLKSFLGRTRLYKTEAFRDKYEDAARRNLSWAISLLENCMLPG